MRRSRTRATLGHHGQDGVTMLEYVLLLALVAMIAVGALAVLGRDNSRTANNVAIAVAGRDGTSANGPAGAPAGSGAQTGDLTVWCDSTSTDCSGTVTTTGGVINFQATGGKPPYTYSLSGNPKFVSLGNNLDPWGGTGDVAIQPSCHDTGTYNGATIVVTDSASPPATGQLTFSLTVTKGSGC